jgi:hypothetical protein
MIKLLAVLSHRCEFLTNKADISSTMPIFSPRFPVRFRKFALFHIDVKNACSPPGWQPLSGLLLQHAAPGPYV